MALATLQFESKYLASEVYVRVILPDKPNTMKPSEYFSQKRRFKVLWLLHGTFGNDSDWLRKSMIELYAKERDLIVVMPGCLNTEYRNWNGFGPGYFVEDYLLDELMPMIHSWLPASERREDNYIGGLSMGSYSSIRLAISHPELFAGVIALSGVPRNPEKGREYLESLLSADIEELASKARNKSEEFGEILALWHRNLAAEAGGADSLIRSSAWEMMAEADPEKVPPIYLAVGEDDFFFDDVIAFKKRADSLGYSSVLVTEPGYGHEWRFWDKYVEKGLEYFGI